MAVEFGVEIGEYRGVVRINRRIFQHLLAGSPTPERCLEAYHFQRTRFELVAKRKLSRLLKKGLLILGIVLPWGGDGGWQCAATMGFVEAFSAI